jgi:hypothetical protein
MAWRASELGLRMGGPAMLFFACFSFALFNLNAQNQAQGPDFSVEVKKVIKYGQPSEPLYWIEYQYEFKNRSEVYIAGLGLAAPSGHLNYLCKTLFLEFGESDAGPVLLKLPLKETSLEMGLPTAEVPKRSDFSEAFNNGAWKGPAPFSQRLDQVLGKYFHPPYMLCNIPDHLCVITTFSDLSDLGFAMPKNVKGEVALMVEYTESKGHAGFKIYLKALESRTHDPDWLQPESIDVTKDAGLFAEKVSRELQGS